MLACTTYQTRMLSLLDHRISGSSRYARVIADEVGEIERRLRTLEKDLDGIRERTSLKARDTAENLAGAIASALGGWADHFRHSATAIGDQSANLGKDAAKLGGSALRRVSEETGTHPLLALTVAVGVGILIGMASLRSN